MPNKRSRSIALSHRTFRENTPFGGSANIRLCAIDTPVNTKGACSRSGRLRSLPLGDMTKSPLPSKPMLEPERASNIKQSMRSGSQKSLRRSRLSATPSTQTESELWIRNDSRSINGKALATPPPVSSKTSRSSEISIRGVARACTASSISSAR